MIPNIQCIIIILCIVTVIVLIKQTLQLSMHEELFDGASNTLNTVLIHMSYTTLLKQHKTLSNLF